MKISKRTLRRIIREEKQKLLGESVRRRRLNEGYGYPPCPRETAQQLMSAGLQGEAVVRWVSDLLQEANISAPQNRNSSSRKAPPIFPNRSQFFAGPGFK